MSDLPVDLNWIHDGLEVWYVPSPGVGYAARVCGEVFGLGCSWCVALIQVDAHYKDGCGFVKAASADRILPRTCESIQEEIWELRCQVARLTTALDADP